MAGENNFLRLQIAKIFLLKKMLVKHNLDKKNLCLNMWAGWWVVVNDSDLSGSSPGFSKRACLFLFNCDIFHL